MYVPEDYSNYDHLVSFSDNYVVLTTRSRVSGDYFNPVTIPTIIQYFKPSIYTIESTQTFTSVRDFPSIDIDSDFYSRADCNDIIVSEFIVILFTVFIINAFTRFFKKGGVFFGS